MIPVSPNLVYARTFVEINAVLETFALQATPPSMTSITLHQQCVALANKINTTSSLAHQRCRIQLWLGTAATLDRLSANKTTNQGHMKKPLFQERCEKSAW